MGGLSLTSFPEPSSLIKWRRAVKEALNKKGGYAKKNPEIFCSEKHDEMSSLHLNNGFRLPGNRKGY